MQWVVVFKQYATETSSATLPLHANLVWADENVLTVLIVAVQAEWAHTLETVGDFLCLAAAESLQTVTEVLAAEAAAQTTAVIASLTS